MIKIKRYLGFTDGMREPLKTRMESTLDKMYSYQGNVINAVSFLCTKLLEGCYLDKEENYTYYKRNGELSKPKTLYKLYNVDGKTYHEILKTEYDFVQYLIDNGINSKEKMTEFDKKDIEKVELQNKQKEEEEKRLEEERRKQEQEKKEFKEWMRKESESIPDSQKEVIDSIFLDIYGQENTFNYTLAVCVNNFDKPMCKEEVKARLHNSNKASIKIFECLTGLKLPSGYKKRMEYLESISSKDFQGMKEYKLRKKREEKEIVEEDFYISMRKGNPKETGWEWKKVKGIPIQKYDIDMFMHEMNGVYCISIKESGGKICSAKTKRSCMNKLCNAVNELGGKEGFLKKISEFNKFILDNAGKNPLYETL